MGEGVCVCVCVCASLSFSLSLFLSLLKKVICIADHHPHLCVAIDPPRALGGHKREKIGRNAHFWSIGTHNLGCCGRRRGG